MAILIPRGGGYWQRKPTGSQEIDWGHELTYGLVFADYGTDELVLRESPDTDNTDHIDGEDGAAYDCSIGQTNREWNKPFMKTSDGSGGGDFTMIVRANPFAGGGAVEHMFAQKNDGQGSPYEQVMMSANSASGSYQPGYVLFYIYNAGASYVSAPSGVDGANHTFIGSRVGSLMSLYRDGGLLASSSPTLRSIYTTDQYTALGSRGNGTTEGFGRDISFALMFDDGFGDDEAAIFSENPYQILKKRKTYFLFPESGEAPASTNKLTTVQSLDRGVGQARAARLGGILQ